MLNAHISIIYKGSKSFTLEIPEGVKHWHGAAKDSWFQHLGWIGTNIAQFLQKKSGCSKDSK